LPNAIAQWSLTTLREKLVKNGAKIVLHARFVVFQMAEVAIPKDLLTDTLRRTAARRTPIWLRVESYRVTISSRDGSMREIPEN
jgi:hypothetical protein